MINITTTTNKTYKFIKSLLMKKARSEHGCFSVEGVKSVYEALCSDADVYMLALCESMCDKCSEIISMANKRAVQIYVICDKIFGALCDTKSPEGVLCVIKTKSTDIDKFDDGLYLYCDCVADPGNAGTLIRTADAVGASGVLFSEGSVDIYNPKTVRSTMGSLFHLPIYDNVKGDVLSCMKEKGFCVLSGALCEDAKDYQSVKYPKKTVIVVGNEANGVSQDVLKLSDDAVIIPILGRAESLNVSVAGSILMYEWRRNN